MRYMLLIYDCHRPEPDDPQFEAALARVNAYTEELNRRGVFRGGEPLRPVTTAATVRVRQGETLVTDGPFAETYEELGGYYLVDCDDLGEAVELAALCPMAELGSVEVRPVAEVPGLHPAIGTQPAAHG